MLRAVLVFGSVFAWGSPQLSEWRPATLDVALVNFHVEVEGLALDAVDALHNGYNVQDIAGLVGYVEILFREAGE